MVRLTHNCASFFVKNSRLSRKPEMPKVQEVCLSIYVMLTNADMDTGGVKKIFALPFLK